CDRGRGDRLPDRHDPPRPSGLAPGARRPRGDGRGDGRRRLASGSRPMSEAAATQRRLVANPWLLLPLAVFLGLAALFLSRLGHNPAELPSALIGAQAPAFALPA